LFFQSRWNSIPELSKTAFEQPNDETTEFWQLAQTGRQDSEERAK